MKKILAFLVLLSMAYPCSSFAQQKKGRANLKTTAEPSKKYPSLLWEITGNGLKKPSYLFGTMHVSDKLVFHLGDSFYNAIRSSDVVALETNPENWQDDYSKSVFFRNAGPPTDPYRLADDYPADFLSINTFAINSYTDVVKASLAVEPSMINGMLYRTYGTRIDDFEEDTFLDMYLFQVGKKLGKKVTGVENFQESEKLVMEAYRDMIKDENKKRRSYDFEGMMNNPKKIEDAYRNGDLDVLDSLENLTVFSDAFQEKFLYKRNLIQANSIDSIIRRSSLFVGVGAAHLPGRRGVIEILRNKGYHLRPINMDERNSGQKEVIDKIHLPFEFKVQNAPDGAYKVSIPGEKFYRFTNWSGMDIVQYADMVNGAYYMVNRVKTNSLFFGDGPDRVQKKIDSLLYENVPGKIIRKSSITRNGYKGIDLINRTRRGDYQRYNIFITPFEVLIFKMSGNGEYVNTAEDAQKFFNSIQLRELQPVQWETWQPSSGGFSVRVPHEPLLFFDKAYGNNRLEYTAADVTNGSNYLVMKVNLHNYSFFEQDSFELNLLNESYSFSDFIDKELSRKFIKVKGYPALECKYQHKDKTFSRVRYIIQGPIYYVIATKYKTEAKQQSDFLESFTITPFRYPQANLVTDSVMQFSVKAPPFKKEKADDEAVQRLQELIRLSYRGYEDDGNQSRALQKSRYFGNDTTGEKIFVSYNQLSDYSYIKDSTQLWKDPDETDWLDDTSFIVRKKREYTLLDGTKCREIQITDTGSSKVLLLTSYFTSGRFYSISTLTDTLSIKSSFLDEFFTTFRPTDTVKKTDLFARKGSKFFTDFFSKDSAISRNARRAVYRIRFDSLDVPLIVRGIDSLNWSIRNYLPIKKYWITALGRIKHPEIVPYLQLLYEKVGDTAELQHSILNALLAQQTKNAFIAFKDLMLKEPPISDDQNEGWTSYPPLGRSEASISASMRYIDRDDHWNELYDSLALTRQMFPDFLQLITLDDYKSDVMNLLTVLVDSGYLKASDYETYFNKIYIDGRQLLKKQMAKEEKAKIEKASRKEKSNAGMFPGYEEQAEDDDGNHAVQQHSILLLPFWDKNPGVQTYFNQLMKTNSRKLLYETFLLLLRNQKPLPDSLFQKFAALDEYRSTLYSDLKKINKLDKFPSSYKKQELIARSLLVNSGEMYSRVDTLAYVDKLPVTYKDKKGYVYFFKYKRMKDDASWQLATVGMQPENQDEVDAEDDEFTEMDNRKLETDKPLREQLDKALKELLYVKHASATGFYEGREANMYRNFLPDVVKNNRYRD